MRHLILPSHRSNTHEFHATLILMNINMLLGANILLGGGIMHERNGELCLCRPLDNVSQLPLEHLINE